MAKKRSSATEAKEVLAHIRKRQFKPIYLLHGDEPYFANLITDALLATVLREEEKGFNQFQFYGRDVAPGYLYDLARRNPMGGDRLLIVVREAQELRQLEPLAQYAKKPEQTTILVLCYSAKMKLGQGKASAAKQLAEGVGAVGYIYEFTPLRDSEVPKWIEAQIADRGLTSSPSVPQIVADQLGTDLSTISNELGKLVLAMPEGQKEITPALVQEAIGLSREFNAYELTKAIGQGQIQRALHIALNIGEQKKGGELPMVIATLYGYFNRLFLVGVLGRKLGRTALAEKAKVNIFLIDEYINAANRYPPPRCTRIIAYLRMWNLRAKGLGAVDMPRVEAYKEIVTYIMLM